VDVSPPLGIPASDNNIGIYVDMETKTPIAVRGIFGLYINEIVLEAELGV